MVRESVLQRVRIARVEEGSPVWSRRPISLTFQGPFGIKVHTVLGPADASALADAINRVGRDGLTEVEFRPVDGAAFTEES